MKKKHLCQKQVLNQIAQTVDRQNLSVDATKFHKFGMKVIFIKFIMIILLIRLCRVYVF